MLLFVDRFVRRPVARLERGVERIAAGDYTTDIAVTSRDELGRLAAGVNSMREQIAGYIEHIDGSVGRLQDVSRALTMTTGGIEQLQDAVLGAADAIAGGSASATMYTKRGSEILRMRSRGPEMPDMVDAHVGGRACCRAQRSPRCRRTPRDRGADARTRSHSPGVLLVASDRPVADSDERALITLANNAAVAIENTRTLEQEREAVRRLSELNQLKSDFLDTAQHELRTPVLAIQGQIELLNVAWDKWDDATRLDIVRDIDISVKLLGETVENVVDFALVNSDTIDVRMAPVDVAERDPGRRQRCAPSLQGRAPGRACHRRARQAGRQRRSVPAPSGAPRAHRQRREVHAGGRPCQGHRASGERARAHAASR